ncbi:MAG: PfkB family carbohydrate kinase [Verrucomicrobia bacterium]|nr:PfkB family carbohydrate kinase [Verrucomicrobiota bacterium]
MNRQRFQDITALYPKLRIAIVGDFCLDRYMEIDPARSETSLETGLAVHNVVNVRSQPGAAGTILNNLVALGIGEIFPVGFIGDDGEGFELRRALHTKTGVKLDHFLQTAERRTFTYCKPLVLEAGQPPVELNRLDSKNWTPTPAGVQDQLIKSVRALAENADAIILMDQVDVAETGVVTAKLLAAIADIAATRPGLLIIADSRRGLKGYPPVTFKMNAAELSALTGAANKLAIEEIELLAGSVARRHGRGVFVTLAERGLLGATPTGQVAHVPALPVRGEIDIVGAGDSVTANLTASLAAGATLRESLEMAAIASSVVIHQLGTTGVATVADIGAFV